MSERKTEQSWKYRKRVIMKEGEREGGREREGEREREREGIETKRDR